MGSLKRFITERLGNWKPDNKGNVIVGDNTVETEGNDFENNTLIGKNKVTAKSKPGRVSIIGNLMLGNNSITVHEDPDSATEE